MDRTMKRIMRMDNENIIDSVNENSIKYNDRNSEWNNEKKIPFFPFLPPLPSPGVCE